MSWGLVAVAGAGLVGAVVSSNDQKKNREAAQGAGQFPVTPTSISNTFGSAGIGYDPQGRLVLRGDSAFDNAFANSTFGQAQRAFDRNADLPSIGQSLQNFNQQAAGVQQDINANRPDLGGFTGVDPIAREFAGLGLNAATEASQGFDATRQEQLALLRQEAAPQEQRAFNSLEQRLFNQGRLDNTGGQQQIESFARGQSQADLNRQLAAFGTAQQLQQGATNRATAFSGVGNNLQNAAFQRTAGASDISAQRAQERFSLAQSIFGTQTGGSQAQLNQALALLGGFQSVDQNAQNRQRLALSAGLGESGAASNAVSAASGVPADNTGQFISGAANAFSNAFQQSRTTQQPQQQQLFNNTQAAPAANPNIF